MDIRILFPMFKAEKFDPSQWAELFKEAGAQFVVPVAGIMMDSRCTPVSLEAGTSAEMGPMRDVLGELRPK